MSDRSDEPNQGWGIVLASDRSPPLSPGSASPPGHPSGQGSVLPHYSHDSVMSLKNILNSEIIQCSRPESSDSSSVPHATFLRTPFEQIAASQFSMMAADQFGGEDFKAIHDTTLEVHGKPPTQFLKGFGEMTYGNTTPPEGLRSVGSASAAGSVNASLHQNLLYGNREGHFSYGQTILTPVSMASSRDSGSAADSGDEEHDGVILANAVDMEIECGHDVQDSPAQRRGRRVPSGTAELLPKSYVTPPLQSAGSPLYSHFHDQYPSFSPSTANLHGLVQRDELGLVGGENDCGRPNDIMELSDLQSIRPGSKLQSIQSSGAAGLGITSSAHPSMNAQHDNTLSSLSALGPAYTPVIDHTDQPATHQAMNPPHVVNNYDNSFSDNSPSHGAGSVSFNSITQEIALETSGELVPTGGHAPTSPESAILTAEGFDATTADTAAVTAVDDSSLPPAQSDESIIPLFLQQAQHTTPISSQILTAGFTIQPSHDSTDMDPLDYMVDDFERNLDVSTLLEHWTISYGMKDSDFPPVGDQALKVREWKRPDEVLTKHLNGDLCDPQGINWAKLGTTRENARMVRNRLYVNYTNIKHASPSEVSPRFPAVPGLHGSAK